MFILNGFDVEVAQLVEHCTEDAGVGGSSPPLDIKIVGRRGSHWGTERGEPNDSKRIGI